MLSESRFCRRVGSVHGETPAPVMSHSLQGDPQEEPAPAGTDGGAFFRTGTGPQVLRTDFFDLWSYIVAKLLEGGTGRCLGGRSALAPYKSDHHLP